MQPSTPGDGHTASTNIAKTRKGRTRRFLQELRKRWYVVMPLSAAAVFGLVAWAPSPPGLAPHSSSATAQQMEAERQNRAEEFLSSLRGRLADEGQATEEVLVSFQRGLTIDEAVKVVRGSGEVVSATLGVVDRAGQEHQVGVLVKPGEDPNDKIDKVAAAMINGVAAEAQRKLECDRLPDGSCQPADQRAVASLQAAAALQPDSLRVYGLVVRGSISALLEMTTRSQDTVLAVEPSRGSPFNPPILTASNEEK